MLNEDRILLNSRLAVTHSLYVPTTFGMMILSLLSVSMNAFIIATLFMVLAIVSMVKHSGQIKSITQEVK